MVGWINQQRSATVFQQLNAATVFADFGITQLDPVLVAVREVLPAGTWIAGGYLASMLAGTRLGDIDIWFQTTAKFIDTKAILRTLVQTPAMTSYGWTERVFPAALSFDSSTHMPISLNGYVEFTGPDAVIDAFDFTVAQVALDGNDLWVGPNTLEHLRTKRLSFHRHQTSVYGRSKKYLEKGYEPDEACWEKMREVAGPVADTVRVLRNQLSHTAGEAATAGVVRPPDPNFIP